MNLLTDSNFHQLRRSKSFSVHVPMSESFLCVSDRNPRRCRHSRGSYSSAVPSYVVCTQARRCVRPVPWRAHVRMILHEVIVLLVVGHQTRDEVHVRLEELFCVGWGAEFDIDIERSCRHWEEYDLPEYSSKPVYPRRFSERP